MATKTLVCLILVAAAAAVPLRYDDYLDSDYACAKKCGSQTDFKYQLSQTYVYEYLAKVDTAVASASEQTALMTIKTLANIEVLSTCEFALRLQDVKVEHSEPYGYSLKPAERSQEFQRALTENPLRFSFDNGKIRNVCPLSEEKPWVLNFKRGLLSAFQISVRRNVRTNQSLTETDVSGECRATFTRVSEWSWSNDIHFTKSKELMACTKHSSLRSVIPMIPYHANSDIQSLPIINSLQKCDHIMDSSKILKSTSCKESHVFAPFSNQQSGGATSVEQTLTFKTVKSGVETSKDFIESRKSLMFEHMNGIDEVSNNKQVAEQKLKEICEQTKNGVRPETPRLFTELVHIVKVLDVGDIENLYTMIKNDRLCSQNNKAMKYLLDTLPIAGTPAAVEIMASILNKNEIPQLEEQVWLTSLSLIREPTEEMIPSLLKVLNSKSGNQALLPASALLNTICKKNIGCNMGNYQFRKIVKKISSNIDSHCRDDIPKILLTLRAIGNIGSSSVLMQSLKRCVTSRYSPLEVKVAALDAYRRFPCQGNEENDHLFQMFESEEIDSEIRIMSYLALMRCPTKPVVQRIISQLGLEMDDSVGSFVSSHLENIKRSSDPLKQDTAKMLHRYFYVRKYEAAGIKASRSFESSALLNRLNLGYVAGSDLIFSGSSMVPRQMNLNLTVQLFGNSVNLLEVGTRMTGLEKFIEKYFGPQGYFPTNEAGPEDLEGFIYARTFGNELFFKQIDGSKEVKNIKENFKLETILDNLSKKFNYKYSHSQQLFDESMIIPTAIGLPLNLTANSSVTVNADIEGNIDLSGIFSRSKPISVVSNIDASAGLEVTGSMMVDAMLYKQGVQMRNTLHSSVNFKPNLLIKKRQILSFDIGLPQKKQELFDARSQFFILHDSLEQEQRMITKREDFKDCTGDKFAQITGLEFCGEVDYPNASQIESAPHFPLTGPARATIVLNKKDSHESYNVFAKWIRNSKKLEAQFQVNTPGSQVDRHISADVTIGVHKNPHVDIILLSPWKKFTLNGKAAKNDDIARLTGSVAIDDKEYKLTSELKMSSKNKQKQYLPFIEVENNGESITILTGKVVHNKSRAIEANLEIKDLYQNVYTTDNKLSYGPEEKRLSLMAGLKGKKKYMLTIGTTLKKSGKKTTDFKIEPELIIQTPSQAIIKMNSYGEFQNKPLVLSGRVSLKVVGMKHLIELRGKINKEGKKYPVNAKVNLPHVKGSIRGNVKKDRYGYSSTMEVVCNVGSVKHKINWNGKAVEKKSKHTLKSNLRFKKYPEYNNNIVLDVTHKYNKKTADLTVYYGKNQTNPKVKVNANIKVEGKMSNLMKGHVEADLKVKVPEKNVDMKMMLNHTHTKRKLNSGIELNLNPIFKKPIKADIFIENGDAIKCNVNLKSDQIEKTLTLVLSGKKNLADLSVKAALLESNKETYSIQASSKMDARKYGKWNLAVAHPERKVKLTASYSTMNDKTTVNGVINLNEKSEKPEPKVEVSGFVTHSIESNSIALKSIFTVQTPFENYETINSKMTFNRDEQMDVSFMIGKNLRKKLFLDMKGSYKDVNHFNLDVDVIPPWKTSSKYDFKLNHHLNEEKVIMTAIFDNNRAKSGYNIELENKQKSFSSDILLLLSPVYEDNVIFKSSVEFEKFPFTISTEISLSPTTKIDFAGSCTAEAIDDMELDFKLTSQLKEVISFVASNKIKRTLTVSHLNIDYDLRRMIDIELSRKNTEPKKLLRLKVKIPDGPFQSFEAGIRLDSMKYTFSKANFEVVFSPENKYEGMVSLRKNQNDNMNGKLEIKTPIDQYKLIEGSFVRKNERKIQHNDLLLKKDGEQLIDIKAQLKRNKHLLNIEITSLGKFVELIAEAYDGIDKSPDRLINSLLPDNLYKSDGKIIKECIMQLKIKGKIENMQVSGLLITDYGKHKLLHGFTATNNGNNYNNMDFGLTLMDKRGNVEINIVSKTEDDIKLKAMISFDKGQHNFGFEYNYAITSDSQILNGALYAFGNEKPDLQCDYLMTDIQHIEFTVTYLADKKTHRKFTYTHEGQDNRINCMVSLKEEKTTVANFELIVQLSPIQTFSLKMITPFNELKNLVILAHNDKTSIDGHLSLNSKKLLSLTGSHNKMKNLKLTIKTVLDFLPLIKFECDGLLTDGNSLLTVEFDDDKKISGNFMIKYENPFQVKFSASINPTNFATLDNFTLVYEVQHKPYKKGHLSLALDKDNQITYTLEKDNGNVKTVLEVYYKDLELQTDSLKFSVNGNEDKITSTGYLLDGSEKMFDADIIIDNLVEKKTSLVVRKPHPMEYSSVNTDSDRNEFVLNWDKYDPNAKVTIQTYIKDDSDDIKVDRMVKLMVLCPSQTAGFEQSITSSAVHFASVGKLFWNNDWESLASYDLQLKDLSDRRYKNYDGELKIKLPTRTVGLAGFAREKSDSKEAQATLSWDLETDQSKKIGLKGVLHNRDHTQADIMLILPKDAHIDNKLVWNKGSTILEGQTNIYYSNDDSKTLTLFTKVENNVKSGYRSYFKSDGYNYSIQLGLSHPESRVDVKMLSHLGLDSDRTTSSLVLNYLNSRRQMKNFDLFLEINKLKKEISLVANNPYKSFGFSGAMMSSDPLELKAAVSVDHEDRRSVHIVSKPHLKRVDLDWKVMDSEFVYSASYPNETSLLLERNQREYGNLEPEYSVLLRLSAPNLLQITLDWKHGLMKEARDRFFDELELVFTDLKELADGIVLNFEKEVVQKYKDISSTVLDDVRSMIDSLDQEMAKIQAETNRMESYLQQDIDFCPLMIGEVDLTKELNNLLRKSVKIYSLNLDTTRYRQSLQALSARLVQLQNSALYADYKDIVKEIGDLENEILGTDFWNFLKQLSDVHPERFRRFWKKLDEIVEKELDPQPIIDAINAQVHDLKDVKIYLELAREYIYNSKWMVKLRNSWNDLIQEEDVVKEMVEFGKLNENLPRYIRKSSNIITQIVEDEIEEHLSPMIRVMRNPITVFDPRKGILRVEVPLFLKFDRLDQMPTTGQVFDKVIDFVSFQ